MIRHIGHPPAEAMPDDPIGPVICRTTGQTWTGANTCHCVRCHRTFTGVTWFDRHQRGGQCLDPATIRDRHGRPVFTLTTRGAPAWGSGDDPHEDE